MTGDMGDVFNAVKKDSQERRAHNREDSRLMLERLGIKFDSHNAGAHLVVYDGGWVVYDFWPGTGLFKRRGDHRQYRGVRNLINRIREAEK